MHRNPEVGDIITIPTMQGHEWVVTNTNHPKYYVSDLEMRLKPQVYEILTPDQLTQIEHLGKIKLPQLRKFLR
jgi:hypothetical protein